MREWTLCLQHDPKDVVALNSVGALLASNGQYDTATTFFRKGVAVSAGFRAGPAESGAGDSQENGGGEPAGDDAISFGPNDKIVIHVLVSPSRTQQGRGM